MRPRIEFVLSLLVYTFVVRLLPYILMNCDIKTDPSILYYPWNFSPLTAICLFGGAALADRRLSIMIPLATLFLTDLGIYALTGQMEWAFPPGRWALTYASWTAAAALGMLLRKGFAGQARKGGLLAVKALALGLSFEVAYFLVSNFLVWAFSPIGPNDANPYLPRYPMTMTGLLQCYQMAVPFFTKSLLGTGVFTMLLFSPVGIQSALTTDAKDQTLNGELAPVRIK